MENDGWVRLPRSIRDSVLWPKARKFTKLEALLDLRLSVNYKPSKAEVGGKVIEIPMHGLLTSQVQLARRWRWTPKTVRRFFSGLILSNILLIETRRGLDHGYTIVTFLNPEDFNHDGYMDSLIEDEKNYPSNVPSTTHIRRKQEESIREGNISMHASSSFEELLEFEQSAQEADYWALSTGPAESKFLMAMGSERLLAVARVKWAFGKSAKVVGYRPAPTPPGDEESRQEQPKLTGTG